MEVRKRTASDNAFIVLSFGRFDETPSLEHTKVGCVIDRIIIVIKPEIINKQILN